MPTNSYEPRPDSRFQGPVRFNHIPVAGAAEEEQHGEVPRVWGVHRLLRVSPYRGGSRRCRAVPLDVPTTLTAPKERSYAGLSRRATGVYCGAGLPENRRKKPHPDYEFFANRARVKNRDRITQKAIFDLTLSVKSPGNRFNSIGLTEAIKMIIYSPQSAAFLSGHGR